MRRTHIGEGSIYQTKAGRWVAAFTIGYDGQGRQVRKTVTAKTKSKVLEKRANLLDELRRGDKSRGSITVETWMKEWLATTAYHRVAPRVLVNYKSINRRHITPTLGKYRLVDIGAEEIRELHSAVRATGVSERTVQLVHGVIAVAMRDAVHEGHLEANPVSRVERPKAKGRQRPSLTVDEAKRMIVSSKDDPLGSMWAAALLLGARRGELIGLEWDRVDLTNRTVDLSWQAQAVPWSHGPDCGCPEDWATRNCPVRVHSAPPGYEARPLHLSRMWVRPKTRSSVRFLPMPAPLVEILRKHKETSPRAANGLVWHKRGRPLGEQAVVDGWRDGLERAGVRRVDFHSARHTTASLLLEAGVPPEVISQMLGHSEALTTRGYMHVNRSMAEEAMGALSNLLDLPKSGLEAI